GEHGGHLGIELKALAAETQTHRTAIVGRTLVFEVTVLDHLLHVVGDVRAEVVAAVGQFADRQLLVADVEENEGLDVVDVLDAEAIKLELHHFEEVAVQALDEKNRIVIRVRHNVLDFPAERNSSSSGISTNEYSCIYLNFSLNAAGWFLRPAD